MTKGFNIDRFKPGTVFLRIRPANSGDRGYIGWHATLISKGKKNFTVRFQEGKASHTIQIIELEMDNFKHGWLKLSDIEDPRFGISDEAIAAIKSKEFNKTGDALERQNRENIEKVWWERQRPYNEREKYKIRHGLTI